MQIGPFRHIVGFLLLPYAKLSSGCQDQTGSMIYAQWSTPQESATTHHRFSLKPYFLVAFFPCDLRHLNYYYLKRSSLVSLSRLEDVPLVCSITENPFAEGSTPVCYHAQGENPR